MSEQTQGGLATWLMLIHQIPPKPDYLRVKIGRRLQRVGAVAVKNSVYALPDGDQALEDFQWIRREIVDGGGDASVFRSTLIDGLTDDELRAAFRAARDADYDEIADAARALHAGDRDREAAGTARQDEDLARLRKRFAAVSAIDFFGATARAAAESALGALETQLRQTDVRQEAALASAPDVDRAKYRARTWVTRQGVFVDRIASAWLIRRFIDPDARFRFVSSGTYRRAPNELRFDMFDGEFTHEGDRCTFETLLDRFGLRADPALAAIAEVVHDIDLKDEKYGRAEKVGVESVLSGIARRTPDDHDRVQQGSALFAALYESARSSAHDGHAT